MSESEVGSIRSSSVYELNRGAPWIADRDPSEYDRKRQSHSSRITTLTAAEHGRTLRQIYAGQRMKATAEYNGLPIAVSYPRFKNWDFPFLVLLDASDPEAPRPLYAVSPKDGHFLE